VRRFARLETSRALFPAMMPLLAPPHGCATIAGGFWIEDVSRAVNANPLPCFHIACFDKTGNP
jgi:hypothetical protein